MANQSRYFHDLKVNLRYFNRILCAIELEDELNKRKDDFFYSWEEMIDKILQVNPIIQETVDKVEVNVDNIIIFIFKHIWHIKETQYFRF